MKIGLINGSPKTKESASETFLEILKEILGEDNAYSDWGLHQPKIELSQIEEIAQNDVLIFAFPLYVDGIPSHLLYCLKELQNYFESHQKEATVYVMVNSGFIEGQQNKLALEMMENWCAKAKLNWGQGMGIGGGGMLASLHNVPLGSGPRKNLGIGFIKFSDSIQQCQFGDMLFISPNFPRFAYIYFAHRGWDMQAKNNGLKRKDLSRL